MAQCRISDTGPLRPTTAEFVAWMGGSVPATFDALRGHIPGSLIDSLGPPPDGVVIVDTPPPEVVGSFGVPIACQILEVADAVVFVAGATRYADAGSFALLEMAAGRGLPTVMVLNRLPRAPELQQVIAADFAAKLARRRLLTRSTAELVTMVAEGPISPDTGALSLEAVAMVTKDVETMADPHSRPDIIAAAVAGSFRQLSTDLAAIRSHVIDAEVRRIELIDRMRSLYSKEARRLISEVRSGKLASVDPGRLVDGLASAATRSAGLAARASAEWWHESAPALIEQAPDLFGHGDRTLEVARERLRFWFLEVRDLSLRLSPRKLHRRKLRRLAESVRLASIDPHLTANGRTARRLARAPGLVDLAGDRLADELRGILETDLLRFVDRLGPAVGGSILTELSTGVPV